MCRVYEGLDSEGVKSPAKEFALCFGRQWRATESLLKQRHVKQSGRLRRSRSSMPTTAVRVGVQNPDKEAYQSHRRKGLALPESSWLQPHQDYGAAQEGSAFPKLHFL